jgi:peptidoglycan/LPS O-acetylase OafA/YrhL
VNQSPTSTRQLDALTGLRFLAAFAVFNLHYLRPWEWGYRVPMFVQSMIGSGVAGVSLFFTLSGFVLAYAHCDWEPGRVQRLKFWSSRLARIYPAYALALLWFAPFILMHRYSVEPADIATKKALASFIPSALLVQSWFNPRVAISWNGPGWTLSVEAVFYLLFPFVAPWVRHLSNSRKISLSIVCWTLSAAVSVIAPLTLAPNEIHEQFLAFNPIFHLPTFVSGMALGYHFSQRNNSDRSLGSILTIAGLALTLTIATLAYRMPPLLVHNSVFLPGFGLLLYGLALGGWPARLLSRPAMIALGEASYSLYILQFPCVVTLIWVEQGFAFRDFLEVGQRHPILSGSQFYLVAMTVCIGTSLLVQRYFEHPLRRYIRERLFVSIDRFETAATIPVAGRGAE